MQILQKERIFSTQKCRETVECHLKVSVTKDSIDGCKSLFTPKYFLLQSKLISSFLFFLAKEI